MLKYLRKSIPKYFKTYLLKNGKIVNHDLIQTKSLLISDSKIQDIHQNINSKDAQVIDCQGKYIIPGGIDTHTHMQLPFMGTNAVDDFYSGSKAGLIGGTTSFIDFVIPSKGQSLLKAYDQWRAWADPKVTSDYTLHCAITDWNQQIHQQMAEIVKRGITSFKFFMAYKGVLSLQDSNMIKAFERARQLGAICVVHAQNGDLIQYSQKKVFDEGVTGPQGHYLSRPQTIQAQAVHRVITIADTMNVPLYVVHVMSKQASFQIMRARNRGNILYGQVLAAGLGTDGRELWNQDWEKASRYVMSPSLNPDPTVKTHLMKMLQSGVLQVVGTDNCTFCTDQKKMGLQNFAKIPNGVNGIQDRMSIVWTKGVKQGLLSVNDFVNVTSTQAAKIFNLYPRKGIIKKGADADLVVWDGNHKRIISAKTHHQVLDYNVFQGMQVYGGAAYTFSKGKLVWNGSEFTANKGSGEYVKRQPFGYSYLRHKQWCQGRDPKKFKVERNGKVKKSEVQQLKQKIALITKQRDDLKRKLESSNSKKMFDSQDNFISLEKALAEYLPPKVYSQVKRILYGNSSLETRINSNAQKIADANDFQIKSFKIKSQLQQTRQPRLSRIAVIQNKIILPTTDPVIQQKKSLSQRISIMIQAAYHQNANIVCLQQVWNAPFFMCTRQKYPWVEFAQTVNGESTQMLKQLAKKYNMVIISPILERDPIKNILHNSALVIDHNGTLLGKQHKGHIPRVGDFNQSTYYMQGQTGHPVFQTIYGKIGVNICYGRHHPLHWMGFGLNGAQIVFNPSATVGALSQPLWPIQARCAAIANHYFAVGINRVGTQTYPNSFTSGDGKEAHNKFGHFYGSSYVASPDGSRSPGLDRVKDGVLITEVDLNMCRQMKDKWGFTMTGRHEIYGKLLGNFVRLDFQPQIIK